MTENATDFSSDMAFLNTKTTDELVMIASTVLGVEEGILSKMSKEDIIASISTGKVVSSRKKTAGRKKKTAAPEPEKAAVAEETPKAEAKDEAAPAEAPKKKPRKTKKTEKTEKTEKTSETVAPEQPVEKAAAEPELKAETAETPVVEKKPAAPSRKKSSTRGRKQKKEETPVEAPETKPEADADAKTEVKTEQPSEPAQKPKRGRKKKTAEIKDKAAEEAPATEEPSETAETSAPAPKKIQVKTKKKKYSFGPSQETKRIDNADDQPEEVSPVSEDGQTAENAEPVQEKPDPELSYIRVEGILSIQSQDKGDFCGFVHCKNYLPGEGDAYVPGQFIRRFGLRKGDEVVVMAAPPKGKERYAPMKKLVSVNGIEITEDFDFETLRKRPRFENLTAVYPDERLTLETPEEDMSTRIIDLFCPIGKGQRGMIVSPPKAGKTILLKRVANSISENNPDCKLIVLLIDERPEEVTDMQRSIKGEVVYSTFDKKPENHVKVTELVLERAMRLVEIGKDVVILLDSMTRLARAYNLTITPTGRTLSGGLDPGSLYGPKRFFGAARNIENGGSLTIVSTALIETGSRMDEVIFEEFKGTGNMEVTLDRKLADRRVFPAIAIDKSGTRREDLLLTPDELATQWRARKAIADAETVNATSGIIGLMRKTKDNKFFIETTPKG